MVSKKVGLKPSVALALMHLRGDDTSLISTAVETLAKEDLGKELCSTISSLVCIMKDSVEYVTPLA